MRADARQVMQVPSTGIKQLFAAQQFAVNAGVSAPMANPNPVAAVAGEDREEVIEDSSVTRSPLCQFEEQMEPTVSSSAATAAEELEKDSPVNAVVRTEEVSTATAELDDTVNDSVKSTEIETTEDSCKSDKGSDKGNTDSYMASDNETSEVGPLPPLPLDDVMYAARIVRTLEESFAWVKDFFTAVQNRWGTAAAKEAVHVACRSLRGLTMSSSFSGIDAPATAARFITYGIGQWAKLANELPQVSVSCLCVVALCLGLCFYG